ncbi:hypothetical protein AAFF_G00383990 [Aldrovandia affinis]|uniref:NFX1-type zinc finger-containing protein 1 n=1 Tax=Aldrovandia affinis TaxID=143900 RepID=A0AAD7SF75_9TELE|nr:hypothetical protein AAFF_G00383990 [Aldrovandia affinis]
MSGRGGHQRPWPTQQQGQSSSSSRGWQGREEHRGTGAPSGRPDNRRGGSRAQSLGRETGRSPWRQNHSTGRVPNCPPLLSVPPIPVDLMGRYNLGGTPWQNQERGRPTSAANPFGQNDGRRGGRNHSQGRIANFSIHPSSVPAAHLPRTPGHHRPRSSATNLNAKNNERDSRGGQLGPSNRAVSHPNLSDVGHHRQGHEHGARRDAAPQDLKPKFMGHRLDFRSLERILQMEPSEVVMKLAAPGSGLKELLDRKDSTDPLTHITLDVLSKACSSRTNRQNLQHLLSEVKDSQFLKGTVPMFVMMLSITMDQDAREQKMVRLKQIIDLYFTLMSVFPASTVIDVSMAVVLLEREIAQLQQAGSPGGDDVSESLGKLQRMVTHLQEKKRGGTLRSDGYAFLLDGQDEAGVESFRNMSIFPTYEDVHMTKKPLLRPNIVSETFRDIDTYLDTHFRLLREDFVKPLRDGISQLLCFDGTNLRQGRFNDIRIYFDARIIAPICTPKGILYHVKFETKSLKMIDWASSKRLLYGALVCLSVDGFETMIFATVANRDVNDLKQGVTTLLFTQENRMKLADVSPSDTFLMVETMAFFEAYRHVLEGLQEMSTQDLPMQRYIVSCKADISPPAYLLPHHHGYSLQALTSNEPLKMEEISDIQKRRKNRLPSPFSLSSSIDSKIATGREMDILNFSNWPSEEQLGLDDSQMKAVQLALTKELAIIQGPPGTGKTFVGLKIVKALLDNAEIWRSGARSPILVVCYTNHALDQFLEGILKFMGSPSGLVRVGGRSSSEELKKLSLSNLRRGDNFKSNLAGHLRAMYAQLCDERRDVEEKIGRRAALFESSAKGVLHESVLEEYIRSLHGTNLGDGQPGVACGSRRKKPRSLMLDWLGISMLSHASRQMEIVDYIEEEDSEDNVSVSSNGIREPEEESLETPTPDIEGCMDVDNADDDLYQSEGDKVDHSSEVAGDIDGDCAESSSSEEDNDSNSMDDLAKATEILSLAELLQDEDAMSEVASVVTDGDGDVADLLQVTEEAEQVQAERMMEGDDMQKHIRSARRRLAVTQRVVLVYVPEEEQEKEEENRQQGDYDKSWEITSHMKKKMKRVVKQELQKTDHMLEEDAAQICDLWALPYKQRWSLYRLWQSKYRSDIRSRILQSENEYQKTVSRIDELRNLEDETVLRNASVIGMTTTCAARYRRVLQAIRPRIVVVEEAAEVLEAHIITTLTPACQHLILIGDHQQLRPSATVYELARNFNLEVSLFERLIRMDVPYVRLDYQHRMRPELARLLTPHIYDKLENHSSVNLYENIKGVTTNIFFVDHDYLEENIHEGRSHQNMHEATFVKALCYYLICQGYKPSQITVLTTYTGQLFCLKNIMPKSKFDGVNLCVVDRYQGEENDIVILSLVRSNAEGKVGFLSIPNRVCVALSRAKKALFCIGNMTMLSNVPLWRKIIDVLSCHGQVGKAMMLRCENHPATLTAVSKPEDFLKVLEGGCNLPCDYRLACGHVCTRLCHPTDAEHKEFKCTKPCAKTLCQDGHRCPKKCFEECGECKVLLVKKIPMCGHEQEVPCSVSLDSVICRIPCNKTLPCGHMCAQACGESCTHSCLQKVTVDLKCGHQRVMQCHVKQEADKNQEPIKCWKKCDGELDCGHACSGNCFQCSGGSAHIPCTSSCNVQLICLHRCQRECRQRCVPCSKPCETQCYHMKCPKLCSEDCLPCMALCGWRCKHHCCTRLCHEPCDRPPCQVPCYKKLKCKHVCIGMCGEPCPDKCRVCNADEVGELFFGNEANPKARFVQLADCRHIFEVEGFDSWMTAPEENGAIRPKSCPKCQTPIQRSVRYNAIVKRMRLDIEAMKRKAAAIWAEHIQNKVERERERMEIKSPDIPPLLAKLTDSDLRGVALVNKQIKLLSQLMEIKCNARLALLPMLCLLQINQEADLCSKNIASAKFQQVSECETEVKRLLCLAEAQALSAICRKSSLLATGLNLKSASYRITHLKLKEVICRLTDSNAPLNKRDMEKVRETLDGVAQEINPSRRWRMFEDNEGSVLDCDFLKLNHWFKCSRGHICYRQSADNQSECCPQCLTE